MIFPDLAQQVLPGSIALFLTKPWKEKALRVMAGVFTFQAALAFVLIASSLPAAASGSSCSRFSPWEPCEVGYVCCNSKCTLGTGCVNDHCTIDADCWVGEVCCNSQCKSGSDCIGHSCSLDADCKWNKGESCCHGTCIHDYDYCYHVPVGVIVGSVLGGLIVILLISLAIFYACRRHQRRVRSNRLLQGEGVTSSEVITNVPQANPPYSFGQMPPSYQQGYSYYPAPAAQYQQY